MATVTLTSRFNALENWVGNLFDAQPGSGTVVTARTTTSMSITLGSNTEFAGYKIQITGTGFSYLSGVPVAGTMSQLRIVDGDGNTVITFGNLGANALARDLSQFYANMFGSPFDDAGPGPDAKMVWNHLLAGNDTINGTSGDDRRTFTGLDAGNDTYNLGNGDNQVSGGIGNDTYNGGSGYDQLTFRDTTFNEGGSALRGVTVNVEAGVVLDPWGGTDRVFNFEGFEGSRFNDVFNGSDDRQDRFSGLRGRDVFDGGANSFVNGVAVEDRDVLRYRDDYWNGGGFGIVVDLETSFVNGSIRGTIRDGFGNVDTVIDIEDVDGTRFNDVFVGSRGRNQFEGGEGRDSYNGMGGAGDQIWFDAWFGDTAPSGINVDLGRATGQIINDGFGNTETALGIEQIAGTRSGDTIKGSSLNNDLQGNDGKDTLTGGGGQDTFRFNQGNDIDDADVITDFAATGTGRDILTFQVTSFSNMTLTLRLENDLSASTTNGTFLFSAANDTLYWDSNGSNVGGRSAVAILTNVAALSSANFNLFD